MKKKILSFCILNSSIIISIAQITPSPAKQRMDGFKQQKNLEENSLVTNVKFHSIGPTVMGGRIVDIDVSPTDPTKFYVAYASGGLWKSENNGQSFTPIFNNEPVMTIGDFVVDWKNNETLWVGTGECNSSRSSYSGAGVFKSSDGGKTWEHKGLEETQHIGKIIIHPANPNTIWVGAIGHLFSPNKERGVFKTIDGGKTWKQTLAIDENTGVIDMVIDPGNPDILYASAWHRERSAWNFEEAGKTSGIYKSIDGGNKWTLLTTPASGFAQGDGIGRIGLSIYSKNPTIIYAILDNQNHRTEEKNEESLPRQLEDKLTKKKLKAISKDDFLKLDDKMINEFLDENGFPEKYTATKIKGMLKSGKILPVTLSEYLEDANALLFDTPVIGAEVYRSDDGGKVWKKMNSTYLDDVVYSYGYYFGKISVSPTNENNIYIVGVPALKSSDGGKTFKSIQGDNVHVDYHVMWIDPANEKHLIVGNDGGLNISYDDGKNWFKANTPAVGQFYSVNIDNEKPYNVYGGLQDNGVWMGPSSYTTGVEWHQTGKYPYKSLLGGDGMQIQVDTIDNTTVYTGFQFGNYYRINKNTGKQKYITPKHELGERPLRWNWQSPILISKHHHEIIYFCSNKFHRSMNRGDDFKTLSGDLTNGGKKGDVAYGTITCIDESSLRFGLIYVGTDDGNIHVSKDAGQTFTKISSALPANFWVRRVVASMHDEGTVYACLNGHVWDNFTSYLFVSKNYGANWEKTGTNLPSEPINVVKEDPKNPNIIYVGTDNGVYVSLNKGKSFMRFEGGLPAVAVHDLVIQPRENEIVLGTHGRSIWIASVKEIQQLNDTTLAKNIFVFDMKTTVYSESWGKKENAWDEPNEPSLTVPYYVKTKEIAAIRIKTEKGLLLKEIKDTCEAGLNYINYNLTFESSALPDYLKFLNDGKKTGEKKIEVKEAENKKYYLLEGKYSVEIETASGAKAIKIFSVKAKKKETRE